MPWVHPEGNFDAWRLHGEWSNMLVNPTFNRYWWADPERKRETGCIWAGMLNSQLEAYFESIAPDDMYDYAPGMAGDAAGKQSAFSQLLGEIKKHDNERQKLWQFVWLNPYQESHMQRPCDDWMINFYENLDQFGRFVQEPSFDWARFRKYFDGAIPKARQREEAMRREMEEALQGEDSDQESSHQSMQNNLQIVKAVQEMQEIVYQRVEESKKQLEAAEEQYEQKRSALDALEKQSYQKPDDSTLKTNCQKLRNEVEQLKTLMRKAEKSCYGWQRKKGQEIEILMIAFSDYPSLTQQIKSLYLADNLIWSFLAPGLTELVLSHSQKGILQPDAVVEVQRYTNERVSFFGLLDLYEQTMEYEKRKMGSKRDKARLELSLIEGKPYDKRTEEENRSLELLLREQHWHDEKLWRIDYLPLLIVAGDDAGHTQSRALMLRVMDIFVATKNEDFANVMRDRFDKRDDDNLPDPLKAAELQDLEAYLNQMEMQIRVDRKVEQFIQQKQAEALQAMPAAKKRLEDIKKCIYGDEDMRYEDERKQEDIIRQLEHLLSFSVPTFYVEGDVTGQQTVGLVRKIMDSSIPTCGYVCRFIDNNHLTDAGILRKADALTLEQYMDNVVLVEDWRNFVDSARKSNNYNLPSDMQLLDKICRTVYDVHDYLSFDELNNLVLFMKDRVNHLQDGAVVAEINTRLVTAEESVEAAKKKQPWW